MGPLRAVFDTNIVIDYLKRVSKAKDEVDRYLVHGICIVTWMEVMAGHQSLKRKARVRSSLTSTCFY